MEALITKGANDIAERAAAKRRQIYYVARRVVRDYHLIEDVCQDVLLQAVRRGNTYNPEKGTLGTWLGRITLNRVDRLRRRYNPLSFTDFAARPLHFGESIEEKGTSPPEALLEHESREIVYDAIMSLPKERRILLTMHYFLGFNYKTISEELSIPLVRVRHQLFLARNNLREKLVSRDQL